MLSPQELLDERKKHTLKLEDILNEKMIKYEKKIDRWLRKNPIGGHWRPFWSLSLEHADKLVNIYRAGGWHVYKRQSHCGYYLCFTLPVIEPTIEPTTEKCV